MKQQWATWIVSLAALGLSMLMWLSGDRVGVEGRVATLEAQAVANRQALNTIQEDVREIRKFLLGERK